MIILCGIWLLLDNTHPNALSLQKIAAENIINSIENKWYTSTRSWLNCVWHLLCPEYTRERHRGNEIWTCSDMFTIVFNVLDYKYCSWVYSHDLAWIKCRMWQGRSWICVSISDARFPCKVAPVWFPIHMFYLCHVKYIDGYILYVISTENSICFILICFKRDLEKDLYFV